MSETKRLRWYQVSRCFRVEVHLVRYEPVEDLVLVPDRTEEQTMTSQVGLRNQTNPG